MRWLAPREGVRNLASTVVVIAITTPLGCLLLVVGGEAPAARAMAVTAVALSAGALAVVVLRKVPAAPPEIIVPASSPTGNVPIDEPTVFVQPGTDRWRAWAAVAVIAVVTVVLVVLSLTSDAHPLVVGLWLLLAAAASRLVLGGVKSGQREITASTIVYRLDGEEMVRVDREAIELVTVAHVRPAPTLVVTRVGSRPRERYSLAGTDPAAFADALRRAGWPVAEER